MALNQVDVQVEDGLARGFADVDADVEAVGAVAAGDRGLRRRRWRTTIRRFRTVRREGAREVTRLIDHYSLAAILAVGYRVRPPRGAQFRSWATDRLSEYLVKGFTLDDRRLKNSPVHGEGVLQPALRGRSRLLPRFH